MLSKTYNSCQIQTQFFNAPNEFETAGYNRQWAESEHWTIGSAALYLSYLWRFYYIYNSVYSSVIIKLLFKNSIYFNFVFVLEKIYCFIIVGTIEKHNRVLTALEFFSELN